VEVGGEAGHRVPCSHATLGLVSSERGGDEDVKAAESFRFGYFPCRPARSAWLSSASGATGYVRARQTSPAPALDYFQTAADVKDKDLFLYQSFSAKILQLNKLKG
jgi:hypothetical protein